MFGIRAHDIDGPLVASQGLYGSFTSGVENSPVSSKRQSMWGSWLTVTISWIPRIYRFGINSYGFIDSHNVLDNHDSHDDIRHGTIALEQVLESVQAFQLWEA